MRFVKGRKTFGSPALWLGVALALGHASLVGCEPDLDALTAGLDDPGDGAGATGAGGTNPGDGGAGGGGNANTIGGAGGDDGTLPAECFDEQMSVDESDVDCGGTSQCRRCDVGEACTAHGDCASRFCEDDLCAPASCTDEVKNQDETGIDCGGSCAPESRCELGSECVDGDDCQSDYCFDEACTDHCDSEAQEADETDVDCGGDTCDPCADNLGCGDDDDCQSGKCANTVCVPESCDDGVQNQDETDEDCGGACAQAKPCALGDSCAEGRDCISYVCGSSDTCVADIVIPSNAVIDDMEDQNNDIMGNEGRVGGWYQFNDTTGTSSFLLTNIPGSRGQFSLAAVNTTGEGFTTWGAGIGFDLNNEGGEAQTKLGYDASQYSGITFWARAETPLALAVVLPDFQTDRRGFTCDEAEPPPLPYCCTSGDAEETCCDEHFETSVTLSTQWQRFIVDFEDLTKGACDEDLTEVDASELTGVQFRLPANSVYNYWIDDIAFVE